MGKEREGGNTKAAFPGSFSQTIRDYFSSIRLSSHMSGLL